jgi:lantibiotic biosynthesis protein
MKTQLIDYQQVMELEIPETAKNKYLETAEKLGIQLCRDAIWADDSCNWLTVSNEITPDFPKPFFKAMDSDFYGGTIGVAFFLANLYDATGEKLFRKTALGAINQAFFQHENTPERAKLGFHSGWTGLAFTLLKSHKLLNTCLSADMVNELYEKGMLIIEKIKNLSPAESGMDIIDGTAGAISALKRLNREFPETNLKDFIVKLGNHLIEIAEKTPTGWSWRTMPDAKHNLTGFAHGAAGMICALTEVFDLTKNKIYLDAAFQGLRYENSHFNEKQQNWPDFRDFGQQHSHKHDDEFPCSAAWCHGAPGIALSRLRMFQLTDNEAIMLEAEVAVKTTLASLWLVKNANFSQCHGLSGNSEVLIEAADILGKDELLQKVYEVGDFGIEAFGNTNTWINGLQNRYHSPDFMLGFAGIGYFYLRLFDSKKYPSVLIIR